MLERLQIHNFQKHSDLELSFDPHLNCLLGKSDCGKSAILRAIRWLAFNRPAGDEFKKKYTSDVWAKLKTGDSVVFRGRRGTENLYKLGTQKFKAFGSDVPKEIEQALNLDQINFQGQHDPPFLLTLTPGATAKELNKIVDLEVIDSVVGAISSAASEVTSELKVVTARKEQCAKEIAELLWARQASVELEALEGLSKRLGDAQEDARALAKAAEEIEDLERDLDISSRAVVAGEGLVGRIEAFKKISAKQRTLSRYVEAIKQLTAELNQEVPDATKLMAANAKSSALKARQTDLREVVSSAMMAFSAIELLDREISALESETKKAKKREKRCPTCGQLINA